MHEFEIRYWVSLDSIASADYRQTFRMAEHHVLAPAYDHVKAGRGSDWIYATPASYEVLMQAGSRHGELLRSGHGASHPSGRTVYASVKDKTAEPLP